jgi:hypothetical protein
MIVLIVRTYPFLRAPTSRALVAVGVAVLIAGCGSSGGTAPAPSAAKVDATANPTASADTQSTFAAQLASQRSKSSSASAAALVSDSSEPSPPDALDPTPTKPAKKAAPKLEKKATPNPPVASTPRTVTTVVPVTRVKTVVETVVRTVTTPSPSVPKTKIIIRKPKPIVRYVTKTVSPEVPRGAFMPSSHPALALSTFVVTGSNVGCSIGRGSVRCDVVQRVWAPPAQPASCTTTWGNAVVLKGAAPADFVCGGTAAVSAGVSVVPDGWDDKVGQITCQVRTFGVDCFAAGRHGFILNRTGYLFF